MFHETVGGTNERNEQGGKKKAMARNVRGEKILEELLEDEERREGVKVVMTDGGGGETGELLGE